MKKISQALILLLFLPSLTFAQEYQEVLRNIFNDGEYWLVEESYPDALAEYQKLYSRGYANNANINYRIGICYLNIPGEKEKSIPYFEKAVLNLTPRYKEGIFKETKTDNESGVPLLRDVPGLGWLFKAQSNVVERSELLIFLTPTVLPPPTQARNL